MHLGRCAIIIFVLCSVTKADGDPAGILGNIKLLVEAAKAAKNIWDFVKDLPPTLGDYLTRIVSGPNDEIPVKQPSSYDFVVDLTRPTDIFGKLKSYPLTYPAGKDAYDKKINDEQSGMARFVINVVGRYNVGKTFILRMLANINLDHSFTERTNGLSVALPLLSNTDNVPMALIDTAGTRTPVQYKDDTFKDRSYERQVSDSFIQEVAINSAQIFVCVVNQLTLDDQLYLKTLYNRLNESGITPKEIKQRLLLVHNYYNLQTVAEVESTERNELEKLFGARKQPQGFWLSDQFKHFVIAHVDTEAGQKYNDRSIEQIRAMIRGANAAPQNDVLGTIIDQIEILLGKVLVEEIPANTVVAEKEVKQGFLGSLFQAVFALIPSSNSEKPMAWSNQHRVVVELEVQEVILEKSHPLWFICPKTPLANNVTLSKNLRFAEDGSVHVDFSSQFIPGVRITRLEDNNIRIAIECPSCHNSYEVLPRGNSVVIRGEKRLDGMEHSKEYLTTQRLGKFEIEVPITSIEKSYNYDMRKKNIKNVYENGVIIVTVKHLDDDGEL